MQDRRPAAVCIKAAGGGSAAQLLRGRSAPAVDEHDDEYNVTYEPFGPTTGWSWGNGTIAVRSYDTDGKITQVDSGGLKTYLYDDAFRITGITDTLAPANTWAYGYDALDRLTSATKSGTTQGWTYDANGNRLAQTGTTPSSYTVSAINNRITSTTGALARSYTYNAVGSALAYSTVTATYKNSGRLKTLKQGSPTSTYVYNALGQRIKQSGGAPGTVLYTYDEAGHLLGEYSSTGVLVQETVWLGDIPVATLRPGTPVGIFYVHSDHLNTPRKITQPSNNGVRWTWDSDAFGTNLPNENPAALGTFKYNLRFPGQVFDGAAGLHQNYFRDYDPAIGRYVESDSIGLAAGVNTYSYVGNNPLSWTDPAGLMVAYNGYVVSNPSVRLNFDILNSLIVNSGIDDNCFVLSVTGGDRYRDKNDPSVIRSATNGSVISNASKRSPHLRDRGARAIDFVVQNKKGCGCKPVTDATVDQALLGTDFDLSSTERNYPEGPHTHINLPNAPQYYPGGMR